ncbi:UNVERIFIED_CONTAM: protein LEO1 [Sesamum latifolium]|uniref:Protein LEO1 n=1 Tax=Sesamum latifolium TaxID=2727402 RepID=A0AAW2UI10_9LAMI
MFSFSVWGIHSDEEQEREDEGKAKRAGGAEVNRRGKLEGVHYDHLGSSRKADAMVRSQNPVACRNYRLPELFMVLKVMLMVYFMVCILSLENEKGKNPTLFSAAVIHEVFGDSGDDEPEEYAAHDWIIEKNDEEQEHENEGKAKREGGAEVNRRGKLEGVGYDHLGSSSSVEKEKGKNPALSSVAVIHEVFGDSGDDEPEEYAARDWINEKNRSPKYKKNYANESLVENIIPDEDALRESEEEGTKTKLKGKAVVPPVGSPPVASEIPLRFPSPRPNQMATINLSSIIGIDPNQFDPATYVEEDFYVTDASGVSRLIPPTNIIRWREVRNPDGTTSVESNARFVTWSDGSLQLLIGNEAFCMSEQDAQGIESYLFLRHGKGPKVIEKLASLLHYAPEDKSIEGPATDRIGKQRKC